MVDNQRCAWQGRFRTMLWSGKPICGRVCQALRQVAYLNATGCEAKGPRMVKISAIGDFHDHAHAYQYVSFDLFDTLIRRRFLSVHEVHDTVSAFSQALVGRRHERAASEITSLRYAMGTALKASVETVIQEPTTEMVWARIFGHETMIADDATRADLVEQVVTFEHSLEMANLVAIDGARELLTNLRRDGKVIIAISDMYFTMSQMEAILTKVGLIDLFDHIYVSAHSNLTKQTGDLFRRVLDDLSIAPHLMLHVGDNAQSDVVMAAEVGITAVLVEQPALIALERPAYGKRAKIEEDVADVVKAHLFSVLLDVRNRKSEHLYFMARDGCVIGDFLKEWRSPLIDSFLPAPPQSDLYLNRVLTCWSNVDFSSPDWLVQAVGIAFWLKQGEATPQQISALLGIEDTPAGLGEKVMVNSHEVTMAVVNAYRERGLESAIRAAIVAKRGEVVRYLSDAGLFEKRSVAFSDVGYSGTVLRALNTLLVQHIADGVAIHPPAMVLHLIATYHNYESNRVAALPFVQFSPNAVLAVDRLPDSLSGSYAWLELFFKHPTLLPILGFTESDGRLVPELRHGDPLKGRTPAQRMLDFACADNADIVLLWAAATGAFDLVTAPILQRFAEPDVETVAQMRDEIFELDPIEGTRRSVVLEIPHALPEAIAEAARKGDYWIPGSICASALEPDIIAAAAAPPRRGLLTWLRKKPVNLVKRGVRRSRGFDPVFYANFYPDLRKLDGEDALWRHYLEYGRNERRLASKPALVTQLQAEFGSIPADFDPESYLFYNPDIAEVIDTAERALDHYMRTGGQEGRRYVPFLDDLIADFDRMRLEGRITLNAEEEALRGRGRATFELFLARYEIEPGSWLDRLSVADFNAMHAEWAGQSRTTADCVIAICEAGLDRTPALSLRDPFDPDYYRAQVPDGSEWSSADLYRHFLSVGSRKGLEPSEAAALIRIWGHAEFPLCFDWMGWRDVQGGQRLRNASRIDVFKAYIDTPGKGRLSYISGDEAHIFLEFLGGRASRRFRWDDARDAYKGALDHGANRGWVEHLLGDVEEAAGRPSAALAHCRNGILSKAPNRWSFLKAASILLEQGNFRSALAILEKGRSLWQEMSPWRELYRRAMHLWSQTCKDRISIEGMLELTLAEADALVKMIEQRLPQPIELTTDTSVLVISGRPDSIARGGHARGSGVVMHSLGSVDAVDYLGAMLTASVVIFHEVPFTYEVMQAVRTAQCLGRPSVAWLGELGDWNGFNLANSDWSGDAGDKSWLTRDSVWEMALVARYCDRVVTGLAGTVPVLRRIAPTALIDERVFTLSSLRGQERPVRAILIDGEALAERDIVALAAAMRSAIAQNPSTVFLVEPDLKSHRAMADLAPHLEPLSSSRTLEAVARTVDCVDGVVSFVSAAEPGYAIWEEAAARHVPAVVMPRHLHPDAAKKTRRTVNRAWQAQIPMISGDWGIALANLANTGPITTPLMAAQPKPLPQNRNVTFRRPRILFVNVWFPPQTIGGATRVLRDNLEYLLNRHSRDFECAGFTSDELNESSGQFTVDTWLGMPVFRVATPQDPRIYWRENVAMTATRFEAVVEAFQPDLVHFHCLQRLTASLPEACLARRIPYFVTLHDAWWLSDEFFLSDANGLESPVQRDFMAQARPSGIKLDESARRAARLRSALLGAERRLAVSSSFASIYEQCGIDCDVVENGATRQHPLPRAPSRDRIQLCHVGGLNPHKGAFLVEAALRGNAYDNLALTIIDLERTAGHTEHVTWGNTPVTIVGRMQADEMAQFYAGMTVLLAPSTCQESYGLVVREALVQGLWVVVGDRGALHEAVVPGKNGFVVDVSDSRALSNTLSVIDHDPVRFGNSPTHPVATRTADDQASELVSLYHETLARHRLGLTKPSAVIGR